MSEITLELLVGERTLTGVDMTEEDIASKWEFDKGRTYHGNVCRFVLDGKTYTALENEDDGYRSSMRELVEGGNCKNMFAPLRVLCTHRTEGRYGEDDVLVMTDIVTAKIVLEVGTHNVDDYYPSFVADFQPQNMASNQAEQK